MVVELYYLLMILRVVLIIIIFLILFGIGFIMLSFRNIVPFVPTPKKIARKMVELAQIKKDERICDLGSGTGRIILAAAKESKQNLIIGVELSPTLRFVTKLILLFHPLIRKRIQIINQNFFNLDLRSFDVIFAFITPEGLRRLTEKFKLLKKGSRIVTYMFPLEDTISFDVQVAHVSSKDSIYIYTKT